MSDNSSSRRKGGVWGHWLPLVVTVTIATAGVAAWVWSQRRDDDDDDAQDLVADFDYENADYGDNPPYGATSRGASRSQGLGDNINEQTQGTAYLQPDQPDASWGSRVSGALRRSPSPQQFFENAGKTVTAGMAAAGAAAGRALAAIREDDKGAYADHETWSEEAEARRVRPGETSARDLSKRRRIVAVVVSADTSIGEDEDGFVEHASILSHIPRHNNFSEIKLFVLIYAPGLKENALDQNNPQAPPSLSSSFSNIDHHQTQSSTSGENAKSPVLDTTVTPAFNAIHSQALELVEKETMVLPFSSPNGYAHMLRHIRPDVVYIQGSLAGDDGSIVSSLQSWLRHDVVLVVGAESGHGGLADSESEAERPDAETKWWQKPERVGRGRGVVVVDGMRVNDDWLRRVQGSE